MLSRWSCGRRRRAREVSPAHSQSAAKASRRAAWCMLPRKSGGDSWGRSGEQISLNGLRRCTNIGWKNLRIPEPLRPPLKQFLLHPPSLNTATCFSWQMSPCPFCDSAWVQPYLKRQPAPAAMHWQRSRLKVRASLSANDLKFDLAHCDVWPCRIACSCDGWAHCECQMECRWNLVHLCLCHQT